MMLPITGMFDLVFEPILSLPNFISLTIFSVLITALLVLANRFILGKRTTKEIQKRFMELREEILKYQKIGDVEKLNEVMKEFSKLNKIYLKQTGKILVISLLVFLFLFPWLREKYSGDSTVAELPFSLPFIGENLSWFVWYIFASFVVSFILKKLLW